MVSDALVNIKNKLDELDFEQLWAVYGYYNFGSPMLSNRILHRFNNFVEESIFMSGSDKQLFHHAVIGLWRNQDKGKEITEFESLRRWFVIWLMYEWNEDEEERKRLDEIISYVKEKYKSGEKYS